jgi:predicted TIM-barrel fold metal-dependent hydrolase
MTHISYAGKESDLKYDYKLINVGSHVNPPPTMWQEYFPEHLRERAPVRDVVDFPGEGAYEVLRLEGRNYRQLNSQIGVATDQKQKEESGVPFARSFMEGDDGQRYPEARLRAMDKDHVDADVLVSGGWPLLDPHDLETRWGLHYAYNSWLGDFCKHDLRRFLGIGEIPLWDMELATKEAHRIARLGLRGVLMPAIPGYVGNWSALADGPYTHRKYDPLWATLNELGLVMVVHADAAAATKGLESYDNPGVNMIINKTLPQEMIASLIVARVFTRYPNLKLVCVETGVGWMAHLVSWMDLLQRKNSFLFKDLVEPPSATFHRHVFGSFLWDTIGVANKDVIGIDNMMWCNDYPHDYGPWPNSRKQIDEDLAELSPEERHKVLAGNAVRVFGL